MPRDSNTAAPSVARCLWVLPAHQTQRRTRVLTLFYKTYIGYHKKKQRTLIQKSALPQNDPLKSQHEFCAPEYMRTFVLQAGTKLARIDVVLSRMGRKRNWFFALPHFPICRKSAYSNPRNGLTWILCFVPFPPKSCCKHSKPQNTCVFLSSDHKVPMKRDKVNIMRWTLSGLIVAPSQTKPVLNTPSLGQVRKRHHRDQEQKDTILHCSFHQANGDLP